MNEEKEKTIVNESSAGEGSTDWTIPAYSRAAQKNEKVKQVNAVTIPGKPVDVEVPETPIEQNRNFSTFANYRASIENIIDSYGILSLNNPGLSRSAFFSATHDILEDERYIPLVSDKVSRLNQYRIISEFPECDWCIKEICSDFLTFDSQGEFIKLNISMNKQKDLSDAQTEILKDEFRRVISLFDIKNNIYDYMRTFLIEGELAFENIIRHDTPTLGIVAVKKVRNDFYDLLIDKETGETCGLYFDLDKFASELQYSLSAFYSQAAQIFNTLYTNGFRGISFSSAQNIVPMLWPQVTYLSSDLKSPNKRISYSAIENVKQSYYQLVLLQDSAVILRVTRSPVRLLFNISTGGMNERDAAEYVRKFGQSLKAKKTARIDRQGNGSMISNTYNPSTMLENWVFAKGNANDGTEISTVESTANYNEIDDIKYFLRRLIKQFGVPYSRYDSEENPNAYRAAVDISQEEFSFAKLELHYQSIFAQALKRTFIIHLKLRGIWEQYKLDERDFDVEFIEPYIYNKYIAQQEVAQKMEVYTKFADRDEFSKSWAMKKYLGMDDAEVSENNRLLLMDKIIAAMGEALPELVSSGKLTDEQKAALLNNNLSSLKDLLNKALQFGGEGGEGGEGGGGEGGGDLSDI